MLPKGDGELSYQMVISITLPARRHPHPDTSRRAGTFQDYRLRRSASHRANSG